MSSYDDKPIGPNPCLECGGEYGAHNAGCESASSTGYLARVGPIHRLEICGAVASELDHAYGKHGRDQWGRHEFYAILKEEVDELWDAIKADLPQTEVRKEAVQIATMVFRYLETADRYREPDNNGGKPPP